MARPKTLPIEKSPFYRLGRKKDLAGLLGIPMPVLKGFASDSNYKEWYKKQKNSKDRLIEQPLEGLDKVQKRLHVLFRKTETPNWFKSGKRGISPQDNARTHCGELYVVNVDIAGFFQSTKREFVYRCFHREFQMRKDIASLLADIVTYKGHIPTGTSTSQIMAFWAYKVTFERIHKLCESKGISMSLWVDDIAFSRPKPFPRHWTTDINKILSEADLQLNTKKTKRYSIGEFKTITGSAVSPSGNLLVRNAKRKEILDLMYRRSVEDLSLQEAQSFAGKLASQRQNEPTFFDEVYRRCRAHIKQLKKQQKQSHHGVEGFH